METQTLRPDGERDEDESRTLVVLIAAALDFTRRTYAHSAATRRELEMTLELAQVAAARLRAENAEAGPALAAWPDA